MRSKVPDERIEAGKYHDEYGFNDFERAERILAALRQIHEIEHEGEDRAQGPESNEADLASDLPDNDFCERRAIGLF